MKNILIITEGNTLLGMGHVYRSLALANLLKSNSTVTFLTLSEEAVRNKIREHNFGVLPASESYEPALLRERRFDTVIIDQINVDETQAIWIKQNLATRLVIFGSISAACSQADVVINAIIGTRFRNCRRLDPKTGTLYLEGPRFVVLREEFYAYRDGHRKRKELQRILLMFGGSDAANLTFKAATILLKSVRSYVLTAAVGILFQHEQQLKLLRDEAARCGKMLEIINDCTNVAQFMMGVDFVITSPGNSLFEAFQIGVPALGFCQNATQKAIFDGFPNTYDQDEMVVLERLMQDRFAEYDRYREDIKALEVGDGRDEIVEIILGDKVW